MFNQVIAISNDAQANDSLTTSTKQQALAFIDNIKELPPSAIWPNIKPAPFLQNIRSIIDKPVSIYAGKGTNFCGYGALSYLMLQDDPLGYAKFLTDLYRNGNATFGNTFFDPSEAVKKVAGLLKFKGILDIHPAEQIIL